MYSINIVGKGPSGWTLLSLMYRKGYLLQLYIHAYAQYVIFFMSTILVIPFTLDLCRQPHFPIDTIPLSSMSSAADLVLLIQYLVHCS